MNNENDPVYDFLKKDTIPARKETVKVGYKLIVADDDKEVHDITVLTLKNFTFENKSLQFIHTYSGKETMEALRDNPDTAVILLDVVMEEIDAGLKVVKFIRNELKNSQIRIILRTGQPGEAPEERIISEYDINDYKLKTELTVQRMYTSLYSALRSYRDIMRLEKNKRGLLKIIESSASLFEKNTLSEFLIAILNQLSGFYEESDSKIYISEQIKSDNDGFVYKKDNVSRVIIAATGKYKHLIGSDINCIDELDDIKKLIGEMESNNKSLDYTNNGFLIAHISPDENKNYIFIEGERQKYDFELINTFLTAYSTALGTYETNHVLIDTQKDVIYALGGIIENHFKSIANHVRRVAEMVYLISLRAGIPKHQCEMIRIAATMHDIGMINIPEELVQKPGKLTDAEFEKLKGHPTDGFDYLMFSKIDVFKVAAVIARHHHEKFDGSGYPDKLKGDSIPLPARIMAVADVFDSLTHEKCYKEKWPVEKAIELINYESGKHFDPEIVKIFNDNINEIMEIQTAYPD